MRREHRLTQVVKQYDPSLFVKSDSSGKMHLIRQSTRYEVVQLGDKSVLYSRPDYQSIFSLTDNWQEKGQAVDWGIEPLMARIREIDSHRSEEILDRINRGVEDSYSDNKRDLANKSEALSYELRDAVKHDFSEYATSSIKTKDIREVLKHKIEKEDL